MKYGHREQEIQVLRLVTVKWYLRSLTERYVSSSFFFLAPFVKRKVIFIASDISFWMSHFNRKLTFAIYGALVWIVIRPFSFNTHPARRASCSCCQTRWTDAFQEKKGNVVTSQCELSVNISKWVRLEMKGNTYISFYNVSSTGQSEIVYVWKGKGGGMCWGKLRRFCRSFFN